jgi:hypothetical protein
MTATRMAHRVGGQGAHAAGADRVGTAGQRRTKFGRLGRLCPTGRWAARALR